MRIFIDDVNSALFGIERRIYTYYGKSKTHSTCIGWVHKQFMNDKVGYISIHILPKYMYKLTQEQLKEIVDSVKNKRNIK